MPHVEPARRSADAVRPISSASSRRAASSGVSPRRTPPPGKCQPARYSALARGQGRHRPRQRRPDASGASVATRCGQAEDQDGKLSARQSREVTEAGLDLTCRQSLHLTMIRTLAAAAAPSVIRGPSPYRRVSTKSMSRPPHWLHTSLTAQSGPGSPRYISRPARQDRLDPVSARPEPDYDPRACRGSAPERGRRTAVGFHRGACPDLPLRKCSFLDQLMCAIISE